LPLSPADHAHASSAAQLWRDAHEQPEQLEQRVGELLGLGSLDDPLGAAVNGYDVGAAIVDQRSRAGQAPSRNGGYLSVASRNA
jgi:hypothetical protein